MAEIKTEDPFEKELEEMKIKLIRMEIDARSFINSFIQLSPRDRARLLYGVQSGIRGIYRFVEKSNTATIINVGVRFKLETFKNNFFSFLGRWRKFEMQL